MGVREAQRRIASDEFAEWLEFWKLRRFGDRHDDTRSAIIAATIAATNGVKVTSLESYMPQYQEAKPKRTPEEMEIVWRSYVAQHNARLKRESASG